MKTSLLSFLLPAVAGFQASSIVLLTVGDGLTSFSDNIAAPTNLLSFDKFGNELDGFTVTGPTLTLNDDIEGDLDISVDGCYISYLGYGNISVGQSTKPLDKLLTGVTVNAATEGVTQTLWPFSPGAPPTYSRADGAIVRPDGQLYMLAGQSGGSQLVLERPGDTAPAAQIVSGFAARGLQIAGREPSVYQLYVGGGGIIRRIGAGLPSATVREADQVVKGGVDFAAGWEFQSDTTLWVIDKANVSASVHEVHVYTCSGVEGQPPCPEGGTWARDKGRAYPCSIAGTPVDVWYMALDDGGDDSNPTPVLYMTTTRASGVSRVVQLDTGTGTCTELVPATPLMEYRGLVLLPSSLSPCPGGPPSPSPSASSSPAAPTPSATPSASPQGPANGPTAGGPTQGTDPGTAAGATIGVLLLVAISGVFLAQRMGWAPQVRDARQWAEGQVWAVAGSLQHTMRGGHRGGEGAPLLSERTPLSAAGPGVQTGTARAQRAPSLPYSTPYASAAAGGGGGGGGAGGGGASTPSLSLPASRTRALSSLSSHPVLRDRVQSGSGAATDTVAP